MATNIRPLHDRVIVRRIEEGEQVRGGIIIPDTAKEKPQEGEVIAAGEGKYKDDGTRQPLDVKVGDRVLFGKYSGSEIKIDGDEYLIMREDEILGILERAGAASSGKEGRQVVEANRLSVEHQIRLQQQHGKRRNVFYLKIFSRRRLEKWQSK